VVPHFKSRATHLPTGEPHAKAKPPPATLTRRCLLSGFPIDICSQTFQACGGQDISMKKLDKFITFCAWAYTLGTILALALMYATGDRWWPGTMLLFGPRWMLALPLIPLLPLALWRRPRLCGPLLLAGVIVFGPFMGLQWTLATPQDTNDRELRVLTCNVQTGNFDAKALSQLIREKDIDLVALQECPASIQLDLPPEWQKVQTGIIAVLSRHPIQAHSSITVMHPPHAWPRHSLLPCTVTTPAGKIIFNSIYLPSPRYGLQHILDRKTGINPKKNKILAAETENRQKVSAQVRNSLNTEELPMIIAGDFNMPSESYIFQSYWSDLSNAFTKTGIGYGWSYRDASHGIPIDIRIDHILTGKGVNPLQCYIGPDIGSDHRPVIAYIHIPPSD